MTAANQRILDLATAELATDPVTEADRVVRAASESASASGSLLVDPPASPDAPGQAGAEAMDESYRYFYLAGAAKWAAVPLSLDWTAGS